MQPYEWTESTRKFFDWVTEWSNGRLTQPDQTMLRQALIDFGAEPNNLNAAVLPSLKEYSNKGRAPAMRAIWGDRFDKYKRALPLWILEVEERTGILLPALKKSGNKSSGMIQIFGEITALAFGGVTWEEIVPFLKARRDNGLLWQQGKRDERVKLVTPNALDEDPKLVSSVPVSFPMYLIAEMSSWIGLDWKESGSPEENDE